MLPVDVPIYVALGPVDLRWSFDLLIGVVRDKLRHDPRAGLVVFLNRRGDRAKILFHDASGWCLLYKRLDRGVFPKPETLDPTAPSVRVSARELELLLLGRDLVARRQSRAGRKSMPILH
jgi:transposase